MEYNKSISDHINSQVPDRREILKKIHDSIVECDPTIVASVEPMMGKEMIIYKSKGVMKYGLSSVKNYMSLHALPIYAYHPLHEKYKSLLKQAAFQKGCINFRSEEEMPMEILKQLITDCAKIDLAKIREEYIEARKKSKK